MTRQSFDGRVSLKELLERAESLSEEHKQNKGKRTAKIVGMDLLSLSVHSFYNVFLNERGENTASIERIQRWIKDCITVMLGEADTKVLTMRQLANRIAEAVDVPDLKSEDRWALYELCFMLTAEMRGGNSGRIHKREQGMRQGTPGEREPRSLYHRVGKLRAHRNDAPQTAIEPVRRQSLQELLQSLRAEEEVGAQSFAAHVSVDDFCRVCMVAKYQQDPSQDADAYSCVMGYTRFGDAAQLYSGDWKSWISVAAFAGSITKGYLRKTAEQTLERHEVLQAYELCYEFINLMADEEHSEGHCSLMRLENLPPRYDVDMHLEEELEEAAKVFAEDETQGANKRAQ